MAEIPGYVGVLEEMELRAKQEHAAMVMSVLKILSGNTYSRCDLVLAEVNALMNGQFERRKKEIGL